MAVRADLKSELISLNFTNIIEQLCIKLSFVNNYTIYIVVSYIPPNSIFDTYRYHLENIQNLIDSIVFNQYVLVFGDFNLPNIHWIFEENVLLPYNINSDIDEYVTGFFLLNDLNQQNSFKNDIGRFLDLIFSSDLLKVSCNLAGFPVSQNSVHHKALDFKFEFFSFDKEISYPILEYNFNRACFDGLNDYFKLVDWSVLDKSDDPSTIYSTICSHFDMAISLNVPMIEPKLNNKPPWFSARLRHLKNVKNKAYAKFRDSKSETDRNLFIFARNEFNFLRNFLYKQYIFEIENKIKSNSSAFWHFLKSKKDNKNNIPKRMHYDNMESDNILNSCNLFSNYFQKTFVRPALNSSSSHLTVNGNNGINFCINVNDVTEAINYLGNDTKSSVGAYPSIFFKKCSSSIADTIALLFNSCLNHGIFLDCWKLCYIVPIFKSGDRSQITNYRPIVKQGALAKIFDSILKSKLFEHVRSFISYEQHGFMPNRSTATNLLLITRNIVAAMELRSQCDVIYTDFAKAFDTVSHSLLLRKLCAFGFSNNIIRFFETFLTDRKLKVKIDNSFSSVSINAYSGIPQGTHIGPLLFLIFINDLTLAFKHSKCLLFADDLKLYFPIRDISDCEKLQTDLDTLSKWCYENFININISKCCFVSYTHVINPIYFNYSISGQQLERVTKVKDLGVIFDAKLTFAFHIDYIVSRAYSMLGFIRRNSSDFKDAYTLKSLYVSLVRSILEYCSIVWNPCYSGPSNRIERIQKLFTKTALKLIWPGVLPSYEARRKLLGMQSLADRRSCSSLLFAYNVLSENIDCQEIKNYFTLYCPPRDLRINRIFEENFYRTNYANNEPIARCLHLCNSFTPQLNFNVSLNIFKLMLFKNYN